MSEPAAIARRNWRKSNQNKLRAISQPKMKLNAFSCSRLAPHARRQQRDDGEHVLQRINHRDERHYAHRQRVVIPALEQNLVLHQNQRQHLQADFSSCETNIS